MSPSLADPSRTPPFMFFATALFTALLAADPLPPAAPGLQLTYRGEVAKVDRSGERGEPEKTFDLVYYWEPGTEAEPRLAWVLEESGRGSWPWLDRAGRWQPGSATLATLAGGPVLLFDHGPGRTSLPLAAPLVRAELPSEEGAAWTAPDGQYERGANAELEARAALEFSGRVERGRNRKFWRDVEGPIVLGYDEQVFVGQGEEYELRVRLVAVRPLEDAEAQQVAAAAAAWDHLRASVGRTEPREEATWTAAELEKLAAELDQLDPLVAGGPLATLARAGRADLELQAARVHDVDEIVRAFEGQPVGEFSIEKLAGGRLGHADLAGQVTVLHFWDYRDEPLAEPYGQVGYLEFLHSRRREAGVQVYGVAVNGRLADDDARAAAIRSVRKLQSFMNLSYPLLLDPGRLVKLFGDPRTAGAALPLFVVIGPDGRVAHYHVGHYAVDRDQGLAELDAVVARLLAERGE